MNIFASHKVLSKYADNIPNPEDLSRIFLEHICEVEGIEKKGDDTIYELKVTPDRGHLLSYIGLAREVAMFSTAKLKAFEPKVLTSETKIKIAIKISEPKVCIRYVGRVVEGVDGRESPAWLREALEAVGQRSINAIVDVTNFVMLETGQPMHSFDANQLTTNNLQQTTIFVRNSATAEKIETLDGKDIALPKDTLVIADSARVLAIAGVKGGTHAGVGEKVNTIILESATFDSALVRKASASVNIRTDSSRRFEHNRAPEIAHIAMERATELLLEIFPEAKAGEMIDVYPNPENPHRVSMSPNDIVRILGIPYSANDLTRDLMRLGFEYESIVENSEERFSVTAPAERFDIRIPADIAEEVARLIGYDNIPTAVLTDDSFTPVKNGMYDAMLRARNTLADLSFSEIFTYAFRKEGKVELANPMAEGINFLRDNLSDGMTEALVFNARNAPLLGVDEILMFEIGTVFFAPEKEAIHISLGVTVTKAMKQSRKEERECEILTHACTTLENALGTKLVWEGKGNVCECTLAPIEVVGAYEPLIPAVEVEPYKKISSYPFMLRDIAMWAEGEITQQEILEMIRTEAGALLVRDRLFDVFEKDGKTSYAFNLVFQSPDRTLSDIEINEVMARITAKLSAKGLGVR
ncbi:MAG: phenylalanine--tRNA ligase subunit beta [bacterium]|nr:phenylalanine--tRNA ligase subunit beta [bacterium]